MGARRRLLSTLAVAAGAALLVWQVRAVGVAEMARSVISIGWTGAALVMALSFIRFIARAVAWLALLPSPAPLWRAVAAFIAGDAAGNLTPLSVLVSEPAKAAYLRTPDGTARSLAALAAENYFFAVSVAVYVMLGAAAMLLAFDLDPAARTAGMSALVAMAVALGFAGWLAWRQPAAASAILSRLPIPRVAALALGVRAFERSAYESVRRGGPAVRTVMLAAVVFHLSSFVEMWLTIWLLTGQSLPAAAFVLDTFGRVANLLFKAIPFQLGVLQVGSELVARGVGLAPGLGVALSLIRTARVMFYAGIGIGLWTRTDTDH